VLVAVTSDKPAKFMRGHVDARSRVPIAWSEAGLNLPAGTIVTGFAAGPLGTVVLGFDRETLRAASWSSRDGSPWRQSNLDAATFDGGAPALLAAGEQVFLALASEVNELGDARTRAWTSLDGALWTRADTDALGAFPPPPSAPCPETTSVNASDLLSLASTYPGTFGAVWPRCFGDERLSIKGDVRRCEGCGGTTAYSSRPGWLIDSLGYAAFWLTGSGAEEGSSITVQVDPRNPVPIPPSGAHVRITGHFDDAASSTCRLIPHISVIAELAPPGIAIETCRRTFVVTSVKVLTG
jgi:hypothetical protein